MFYSPIALSKSLWDRQIGPSTMDSKALLGSYLSPRIYKLHLKLVRINFLVDWKEF